MRFEPAVRRCWRDRHGCGRQLEVTQQQLGYASIGTTLGTCSHLAAVDDTATAAVEEFVYGAQIDRSRAPEWLECVLGLLRRNATPNRSDAAPG